MLNRDDLITAIGNRSESRDDIGQGTGVKRRESDRVSSDVDAYLAKGGQIQVIPKGQVTIDFTCERRAYGGYKSTARNYKSPRTMRAQMGTMAPTRQNRRA